MDLVSTVTASILIGNRHRYRGGIQPGWLLLVHEGSSVTLQLLRLHVFDGEELGGLDEQPGIRWAIPGGEDLVGALSLMLQLHLTRNADLIDAVRDASALLTERVVTLDRLSSAERAVFDAAVRQARTVGDKRCLAVSTLPDSRLDAADLLTLPGWEIDVAQSVGGRDWNALEGRLVLCRRIPDLLKDQEIAVSRFVTGVVFGGLAGATVGEFIEHAASQADECTPDTLGRWIHAGLVAIQQAGGFEDGEAAGLADVLDDLTPNQAHLLGGFLPATASGSIQTGAVLHGTGELRTDVLDLFALACRVAAQAVALTSNAFHLPPWLVLDALDPTTPRRLSDYV
jgi:hypothetical protein